MENHNLLRKELFTIYKVHRFLIAEFFLIALATFLTPFLEVGQPGAKILTLGDALWWVLVTATNTGYGDLVPLSFGGKVIATILMFSGFALYSVAVGIFVIYVNRHRSRRNWQRTQLQLEEINKKLERLENQEKYVVKSVAKAEF